MSDHLVDLIKKLLDRNPETRLGTKNDVIDVVTHPFFEGLDFEKLVKKEIVPIYKPSVDLLTLKDEELLEMMERVDL